MKPAVTRSPGPFQILLVVALLGAGAYPTNSVAQQPLPVREAIAQLVTDLAEGVPPDTRFIVAVADFPGLDDRITQLGQYIAERLTTRLSQIPEKFQVVERRRIDLILGELNFGLTDLVDPEKRREFGRLLGIDLLLTGTLSDLPRWVEVDVRLVEIETSNVLPGAFVPIVKDELVTDLLARVVGTEPTPGSRRGTSIESPDLTFSHELYEIIDARARRVGPNIRVELLFVSRAGERRFHISPYNPYLIDDTGVRYEPPVRAFNRSSSNVRFQSGVPQWIWHEFGPANASATSVSIALEVLYQGGHVGARWATVRGIPVQR